jgi:hypothetical protein
MIVRECFIECAGKRRDADVMWNDDHGKWFAQFTQVPQCLDGTGKLTVVGENQQGQTFLDSVGSLFVDPAEKQDSTVDDRAQIHLTDPPQNTSVQGAMFKAKGFLDQSFTAKRVTFLCGSSPPRDATLDSAGPGNWEATFTNVPPCSSGTVIAVGNNCSSQSHGNIRVT